MPISNPLKLLKLEDLNLGAGAYLDTGTDEGELIIAGAISNQVVTQILDAIFVGQLAYFPAGGSIGAKWLLCDGSSFDGLQYSRLAAFLGVICFVSFGGLPFSLVISGPVEVCTLS